MGPPGVPRQVGVDACPSRWSWREHQRPHPRRGGYVEEEQGKASPRQREEVAHVLRQPAGTSDGGFSDTKHITTPIILRKPRVVAKVAPRVSHRRSLPGAVSVPGEGTSARTCGRGPVGLAVASAPAPDSGARMTRKNLRNVVLCPEGSGPLGRWGLRLQQEPWSPSCISLHLRPSLPGEGEGLRCFWHHPPGLAHTRRSRNACVKPAPAKLQATCLLGELIVPHGIVPSAAP